MGSPVIGQRWEIEEHPVWRDIDSLIRSIHADVLTPPLANQADAVHVQSVGSN